MKRYEALETLFGKVDLSFAEKLLNEAFHARGSCETAAKATGAFNAHLLKRLRHVPSDRMLIRWLWKDPRLKRMCDIKVSERPFGIAVLSRFRSRVGTKRVILLTAQAAVNINKPSKCGSIRYFAN
jgi:hypothetical protein